MTNLTQLEKIRALIEERKSVKVAPIVKNVDLEIIKKDVHVAVSPKQISMYLKLVTEKGEQLNPLYRTFDGRKNGLMDKEIQRLLKLPSVKKPTEAQLQVIVDICERQGWELPETANLTGGRDGSCSALISELIGLEKEAKKIAPPTENQITTILEMYHCPDVDFSDLNDQYALVYVNQEATNQIKGAKLLWTRPSQEMIASTIMELITYEEASAFIYKFALDFFKWKNSRLSTGQMNRIKKLQTSCGMIPMLDEALLQFDKKTANDYINNLNLVRRDVDLVKFPQEALVDDISRCNTVAKGVEAFIVAKDEMIHNLYTMCGMNSHEESETSIDLTDNDDIIADLALIAIGLNGSDAVMDLLSEVYTIAEMKVMVARMYPEENDIVDQMDGMTLEELEALAQTLTA